MHFWSVSVWQLFLYEAKLDDNLCQKVDAHYLLPRFEQNPIQNTCYLKFQTIIYQHNVVRSGGRGSARGARGGARATLFVRSLHRARVDQWGSSLIHAFLLQVCLQLMQKG